MQPHEYFETVQFGKLMTLAEEGFPGATLGDLVQITEDQLPNIQSLFESQKYDLLNGVAVILCQAFSNALVYRSRGCSDELARKLCENLAEFDIALNHIMESISLPAEVRETVADIKGHTEQRLQYLDDLRKRSLSDQGESEEEFCAVACGNFIDEQNASIRRSAK